MRYPVLLLLLIIVAACSRNETSENQVSAVPAVQSNMSVTGDTIKINLKRSTILWKATEMRGTITRRGKIGLKSGFLLQKHGLLVGGVLIVDMNSMDVTDVPAHEHEARNNLVNHLKSDDFFNVPDFPLSILEITSVNHQTSDSLKVAGNLTIRGITKNIAFKAIKNRGEYRANFQFDRFQWNIAYEGSWAARTLVDRNIELDVTLIPH